MSVRGSALRTVWDPAGPDGLPFGSNSMQHGTAVFEGIRCYPTADGPSVFRLDDHLRRLLGSARQLGIPHDYDLPRLRERVLAAANTGGPDESYLRPVLYTPDSQLGVDLGRFRFVLAVEVYSMAPTGTGADGLPPGVRLTVSPWRRPAATSFPPQVKATGTYAVSALARTAAAARGFDDAIQLDPVSGRVAEATVANVFLVRDGRLLTPWLSDSLLAGITRDTVLVLARQLGIDVVEGPVELTDLHQAQEVFLTGTAAELVPASEIDGHGTDPHGPVFRAVAEAFRDAVRGRRFHDLGWLTRTSEPHQAAHI